LPAEAQLARLHRVKQAPVRLAAHLGPEMIGFFHQSLEKRHTKMSQLARYWCSLVPPLLDDHCTLDSFHRGTLTVRVDSAAHLYELKQLLLAGLQEQLLFAGRGAGLRKITLKPGREEGGG
jgi:hypothetical protein